MCIMCKTVCQGLRICVFLASGCVDIGPYCEDWSKNGECENNPDYMKVNCAKSCQQCNGEIKQKYTVCSNFVSWMDLCFVVLTCLVGAVFLHIFLLA